MADSIFLGGLGLAGGGVGGSGGSYATMSGAGHPQGVVTGVGGDTYRDTATGLLYLHVPVASSVWGWVPLVGETGPIEACLATRPGFCSWRSVSPGTNPAGDTLALEGNGLNLIGYSGSTISAHRAADAYYSIATTTAAVGVNAGFYDVNFVASMLQWSLYNFDAIWRIRTSQASIADTRIWCGLGTVDPTNSDSITGRYVGFRYSSVVGATWNGVSNDNTGQAVSASLGAIAVNTAYTLRVRYVRPNAYLSIDHGPETTITSKVPTDTTNPYHILMVTNISNTPNATRAIELARFGLLFGL